MFSFLYAFKLHVRKEGAGGSGKSSKEKTPSKMTNVAPMDARAKRRFFWYPFIRLILILYVTHIRTDGAQWDGGFCSPLYPKCMRINGEFASK